MALKLLQPGLRPMGQFDLDDDDTAANITGGEICSLTTIENDDYYAADVEGMGEGLEATLTASTTTLQPLFMADEGIKGYGTLFGELIGSTVGQATSQSGATVIGPRTSSGSGKITLWHAPGLYAVSTPSTRGSATGGSADAFANGQSVAGYAANSALYSSDAGGAATGKLTQSQSGADQVVAFYLGGMADDSLVSTTIAAATGTSTTAEFEAIYFLGPVGHLA